MFNRFVLGINFSGIVLFLSLLFISPVAAASANLSRSYKIDSNIPNGSIVSLDTHRSGYVLLANISNDNRLLGVALPSSDSLLAVDPSSTGVQVAINGSVNTLVSTINGNIQVGQQISASPFNGIGMLAPPGSHIIGTAQTTLTKSSNNTVTQRVTDKNGKSQSIKVGFLKLTISVGANNSATAGGSQANFLQRLIKSLTGHTISTVRIVLSIVVAFISLVSLIALIYASIYGSIISIGRNPLAKHAVFRTLASVMAMALLTVAIACITIYFLLR